MSRRLNQNLPEEQSVELLMKNQYGTLSLCDSDNAPYAVPINYFYDHVSRKLIFHGETQGKKFDILKNHNNNAVLSVVDYHELVPSKFTAYYKSVIAKGKVSILTEGEEFKSLFILFSHRFSENEVTKQLFGSVAGKVALFVMNVTEITGKQSSNFVAKVTSDDP